MSRKINYTAYAEFIVQLRLYKSIQFGSTSVYKSTVSAWFTTRAWIYTINRLHN